MKKLWNWFMALSGGQKIATLIGVAVVGIILTIGWVWADVYLLEDGSVWTTLPEEAAAVRRIEAQGTDFRVYEFYSEVHPNLFCVFMGATEKAAGGCVWVPDEALTR